MPSAAPRTELADRPDDLLRQLGEPREVLAALSAEPLDESLVLVAAALAVVQPPRLQELDVVDAGHVLRHLVAELRLVGPLDRILGDGPDDRGAHGDLDLLGAIVVLAAADPPSVHQEHLDGV